jgi:hypothetical protein
MRVHPSGNVIEQPMVTGHFQEVIIEGDERIRAQGPETTPAMRTSLSITMGTVLMIVAAVSALGADSVVLGRAVTNEYYDTPSVP